MKHTKLDPIVLFLIRRRKKDQLTQEALSEQCPNLTLRTLQRIEQGRTQIDLQQLREYCDVMNITLLDLSVMVTKGRHIQGNDVAAVAKLLPASVRQRFYDLMVEVLRQNRVKDLG